MTERPSPVVGSSFTDSLEGTIGVATHHDGMSGTERQDVADDYSQRISESQIEAEAGNAFVLFSMFFKVWRGKKEFVQIFLILYPFSFFSSYLEFSFPFIIIIIIDCYY